MKTDEAIAAARRRVMEAEAGVLHAFASMRALLNEIEEENRELRQQVNRHQVEILTESEFAKRLKVSPSTIARLRKRGVIEPMMVGDQIRYTSAAHLERVEEIFGAAQPKPRRLRNVS